MRTCQECWMCTSSLVTLCFLIFIWRHDAPNDIELLSSINNVESILTQRHAALRNKSVDSFVNCELVRNAGCVSSLWQPSPLWLHSQVDPGTRERGQWPGASVLSRDQWWPEQSSVPGVCWPGPVPVSLHHPLLHPLQVLHLPSLWLQDELSTLLHLSPWWGEKNSLKKQ